jgi:cell division protease FtsH
VAKIKVSLGGRAAEKVIYGEVTTGAESDIQQLTKIARGMVGRWGMSDAIGPLALGEGREGGEMLPGGSPLSPATQQTVDEEAQRIVETAEREVVDLLERERPRLEALARRLLERETLDQPEAYRVARAPRPGAEQNGNGTTPPSSSPGRRKVASAAGR